MPRAGDVVGGKYRIESMIGEGGMGAVFAATHLLTGKRVALKWMLPELATDQAAVQRFMREAQAAGRIDHVNVVDVYDVGEHDGSWFLVMEYLNGETLTVAFKRGALEVSRVIQLLLPAMRGVAAAHRTGVIHRDLKPDNIFLCRASDGGYREPKVLDFGISKLATGGDGQDMRLTRTGAVMGTPYYMSPEQIRGSSDVDARTDVYAFGVILYEALTGRVPFDAESYSALVLEIATGTAKRPRDLRPELPPELERVVLKAMAREVEDRYASIEQFARALEPFADGATFRIERSDPTGPSRTLGTGTTPFASEAPVEVPVHRSARRIAIAAVLSVAGLLGLLAYQRAAQSHDAAIVRPAPPGSAPRAAASLAGPSQAMQPETVLAKPEPAAPDRADAGVAAAAAQAAPARATQAADTAVGAAEHAEHARHQRRSAPSRAKPAAVRRPPAPSARGRSGQLNADQF